MNFDLTTQANQALESYAKLLLEWNEIHSLSGARDLESIYKNIQDSLYPLEFLGETLRSKTKLFDVGSGNGFPAVALGIALGIEVVLCEPNAKKAAFLQNLKSQLGLKKFMILRKISLFIVILHSQFSRTTGNYLSYLFFLHFYH